MAFLMFYCKRLVQYSVVITAFNILVFLFSRHLFLLIQLQIYELKRKYTMLFNLCFFNEVIKNISFVKCVKVATTDTGTADRRIIFIAYLVSVGEKCLSLYR